MVERWELRGKESMPGLHLPGLFPHSVGFPERELKGGGWGGVVSGVGGGETTHLHHKGSSSAGVKASSWACCLAECF